MPETQTLWLNRIHKINVNRSGERRSPHKPLLLMLALSRFQSGQIDIPYADIDAILTPLLKLYAPPVQGRPQPSLPYWHLQTDGLWSISDAERLPTAASGFPRMEALRQSSGHLNPDLGAALTADPALVDQILHVLLMDHFPASLHEDICAAFGLELPGTPTGQSDPKQHYHRRRRDPAFRDKVLRAYEYRCAVTGFCAALGGSYFGCEAAHVRWVAYDGPDTVENGLALEPTLHKLFDAGAWSLTDDRRILVSADLSGENDTMQRIRTLHGKPLSLPQPGQPQISLEFIHWHRKQEYGGVFRLPAMPL